MSFLLSLKDIYCIIYVFKEEAIIMISIEQLRSKTTISKKTSEIFSESVREKIISRIHEVILIVDNTFGLTNKISDYDLEIDFPKSIRYLGKACWEKKSGKYSLKIQLNKNALSENLSHMMEDVIPHEIAHLVCYVNYSFKGKKVSPHGKEWKTICARLGGNPKSISEEKYKTLEAAKVRKVYRYEYALGDGSKIVIAGPTHKKIQSGVLYSAKSKIDGRSYKILKKSFTSMIQVR